jgi:hypothetical protein
MAYVPSLKVSCPNATGFVGTALLKVFKEHGEFLGQTTINCPGTSPTIVKPVDLPGHERAHSWNIQLSLTNTTNGHNASQSFSGQYTTTSTESIGGQVTVDGVTMFGGTALLQQ